MHLKILRPLFILGLFAIALQWPAAAQQRTLGSTDTQIETLNRKIEDLKKEVRKIEKENHNNKKNIDQTDKKIGKIKNKIEGLNFSIGGANTDSNSGALIARALFKDSLEKLAEASQKEGWGTGSISSPDATPSNPNPRWWYYTLRPEFDFQGGESDSFSSFTIKLSGHIFGFATQSDANHLIGGKPAMTVKTRNTWTHVYPVALGFETDQNFETGNAIFEIGYAPIVQGDEKITEAFGFNPFLALYFQGGYKFDLNNSKTGERTGGQVDESKESVDSELFRIKFDARYETALPVLNSKKEEVKLLANAKFWYDISNNEFYDRQEITIRWSLTDGQKLDFTYENGSGAPNFNQGQQFSTRLTVSF